jgi:hypothetical protein
MARAGSQTGQWAVRYIAVLASKFEVLGNALEKSWKEAIKRVLKEPDVPLHYTEISDHILTRGYYATDGATPAATVNAQLSSSVKHDGEKSPFIRVGKGVFSLRGVSAAVAPLHEPKAETPRVEAEEESSDSIIHSFGMYWQRDLVVWRSDLKMFGKQQSLSKPVNFAKQKGIYILYDHHTVVYVGRAIDRPLGKRIYEHTVDRLGSRWNRFSWFGLLDVTQEGNLRELPFNSSLAALVATLGGWFAKSALDATGYEKAGRRTGDLFQSAGQRGNCSAAGLRQGQV